MSEPKGNFQIIAEQRAEIERLRRALEKINQKCSDFERMMMLPTVKEFKEIWYIALDALEPKATP